MTADDYERQADRAVERILADGIAGSVANRRETAAYPDSERAAEEALSQAPALESPEPTELLLSLEDALDVAIQTGRDYVTQKEALYLNALSLAGTRNTYSPLLSTILAYNFSDGDGQRPALSSSLGAGVTQVLPWGADISASLATSYSEVVDLSGSGNFSSSLGISYTQPLLRGAGHKIAYEPLIQAERSLIYAIRDFERFRESYAIDVAQRYYDLVGQMQSLENQRYSVTRLEFGTRQAEARFQMGEIKEVEVFRSRRAELRGANDLLRAKEDLQLALDRFRVFLGLGDELRVSIVPTSPEFVAVDFDVDSAISVALQNRLDYITGKEQLVDLERRLAIAENRLQGSLDLSLSHGVVSGPDRQFLDQRAGDQAWSAGLTYDLPVNRVAERNAYRSAQIALTRARRDFDAYEDNLVVDLRSRFRALRRIEQSLELQRELIEDEQRGVVIAQLLVDRGESPTRDLVEAQESLLQAQNSLVNEQVNYEIQRLNLLRDMGILFIDENGMWTQ